MLYVFDLRFGYMCMCMGKCWLLAGLVKMYSISTVTHCCLLGNNIPVLNNPERRRSLGVIAYDHPGVQTKTNRGIRCNVFDAACL